MLEYDRTHVSEGIDVNKAHASENIIFAVIGILKILVLNINFIFALVAMI